MPASKLRRAPHFTSQMFNDHEFLNGIDSAAIIIFMRLLLSARLLAPNASQQQQQ